MNVFNKSENLEMPNVQGKPVAASTPGIPENTQPQLGLTDLLGSDSEKSGQEMASRLDLLYKMDEVLGKMTDELVEFTINRARPSTTSRWVKCHKIIPSIVRYEDGRVLSCEPMLAEDIFMMLHHYKEKELYSLWNECIKNGHDDGTMRRIDGKTYWINPTPPCPTPDEDRQPAN